MKTQKPMEVGKEVWSLVEPHARMHIPPSEPLTGVTRLNYYMTLPQSISAALWAAQWPLSAH